MKKAEKNWTELEKNVFLTLLQVSGSVIENKSKLKSKMFEWHCIQKKFREMTGNEISVEQLKNKWQEMKACANWQLQLGNVSSSEHLKVLGICFGIYNEVDDFDISKIRNRLLIEFQVPKLNSKLVENIGNRLNGSSLVGESSGKRKRCTETVDEESEDEKRAAYLEEFKLKKLHLEKELEHQAIRHEMEIEILNLKKKIMLKRLDVLNKKTVT